MKAYWLRVFGAWLLLHFASRVMKSAEGVLNTAYKTPTPSVVPEGTKGWSDGETIVWSDGKPIGQGSSS